MITFSRPATRERPLDHPYTGLDRRNYWRTAVSEIDPGEPFQEIWTPKFYINRETRLISAGSCFAQHVGGWLRENGYDWLPSRLAPEAAGFSFALGNIYTPAALSQWLKAALGELDLEHTSHAERGVHYDLLRPTVFSEGFPDLTTMRDARQAATRELLTQIERAQVFIFTLGLTEAWLDERGTVYPVCPGTVAGRYEPARHRFKNYDYQEILDDLLQVRALIDRLNPDLKIILTVSPVPLTATASREHVLVATTHSKSVLRSVAGYLSATDDRFDYFLSYELINAPQARAMFFADNLRSVTRKGVDYVLAHFSDSLQKGVDVDRDGGAPIIDRPVTVSNAATDLFCDEEYLDSGLIVGDKAIPDVLLVGDSHMGKLSQALGRLGIAHLGGRTMNGSSWVEKRFALDEGLYFTLLDGDAEQGAWEKIMEAFKRRIRGSESDGKPVLFTNIGLHTHQTIDHCWNWLERTFEIQGTVSHKQLEIFFQTELAPHLALLERLALDFEVILISDPPLQSFFELTKNHVYVFEWYESGYEIITTALGCEFFNTRRWLAASGEISEKYRGHVIDRKGNEDWLHGSDIYYRDLAKELASRFLVGKPPETVNHDNTNVR